MSDSNGNPSTPRFRLAPTPSGLLHSGNAASFLLTWLLSRHANGNLLLRIDDLDRDRFRMEYLEDIFRTIDWLGIDYDQGPSGPDDFIGSWSQTLRMASHENLLSSLLKSERIFGCECSRSKLSGGSTCACFQKGTIPDKSNSWRFYTQQGKNVVFNDLLKGEVVCNIHLEMGNFIVRKRDQSASYQIASLSDDIHFGITHIVRGEDLVPSTAAQLLLDRELNSIKFSSVKFLHHPLLKGESGLKLSKSAGGNALKKRDSAQLPVITECVRSWLGIHESIGNVAELFDASKKVCRQLMGCKI